MKCCYWINFQILFISETTCLLFQKGREDLSKIRDGKSTYFPSQQSIIPERYYTSNCSTVARITPDDPSRNLRVDVFFSLMERRLRIEAANIRHRMKVKEEAIWNPGQNLLVGGVEVKLYSECLVCQGIPTVLLTGCKHAPMCPKDWLFAANDQSRCPCCRAVVDNTINIFPSARCRRCQKPRPNVGFTSCNHVSLCATCSEIDGSTLVCPKCYTRSDEKFRVFY